MNRLRVYRAKAWRAGYRGWPALEDPFSRAFDKTDVMFIHVPKAAGSSIAKAIYGTKPWHYRIDELATIDPKAFACKKTFAFVRNPWTRVFSAYNYAFDESKKNPNTSVRFVADYDSFDAFITHGLTEEVVKKHYFFWPQCDYLYGPKQNYEVDFVGRFETVDADFQRLCETFSIDAKLPYENKTQHSSGSYLDHYSQQAIEKVAYLYSRDIEKFGFQFPAMGAN